MDAVFLCWKKKKKKVSQNTTYSFNAFKEKADKRFPLKKCFKWLSHLHQFIDDKNLNIFFYKEKIYHKILDIPKMQQTQIALPQEASLRNLHNLWPEGFLTIVSKRSVQNQSQIRKMIQQSMIFLEKSKNTYFVKI